MQSLRKRDSIKKYNGYANYLTYEKTKIYHTDDFFIAAIGKHKNILASKGFNPSNWVFFEMILTSQNPKFSD